MAKRLSLLLALGLTVAGCKTITEELPTSPSSGNGAPVVTVPFPVQVTPIIVPTPEAPAPATPTPAPNPGNNPPPPTPTPESGDDGSDGDGDGEDIPNNRSPVAKVVAKVFFVECGDHISDGSLQGATAQVGCRVHLDVTAKDAGGKPTRARGGPDWHYSDSSAFTVSVKNPYTPVLEVKRRGSTRAWCTIDGVRSQDLSLRFE
jgi:hypothetical protein